MRQFVEQPLGNGVIGSFAVPHAALVAAAQMDAEGDAGIIGDDRRFRLQRTGEIPHRIFAARAICAIVGSST